MKLKDIAKKINKAYASDNIVLLADAVPEYKRLKFRSLGVSYPSFGGLPLGRSVTISGVNHSGKTTLAVLALAEYQRQFPDKICVFVDVEHTADLKFLSKSTGLDLSKLYYVNTDTLGGEAILDLIVELQQSEDIGAIVLDSIPALISSKKMDTEIEKNLGMSGHMAIPLQTFLNKMTPLVAKHENLLILINQVREKITPSGAIIYTEPGGSTVGFVPSVKIRCGRRTYIKGDKDDLSDGKDADGFKLHFVFTKNKTAQISRGGGFVSFSYEKGLDIIRDTLDIATNFGFIDRAGAYYTLINPQTAEVLVNEEGKPLKFQGKAKITEYLEQNPDFADKYIQMLTDAINGNKSTEVNLLDGEILSEILEEEKQVEESIKKGS